MMLIGAHSTESNILTTEANEVELSVQIMKVSVLQE